MLACPTFYFLSTQGPALGPVLALVLSPSVTLILGVRVGEENFAESQLSQREYQS